MYKISTGGIKPLPSMFIRGNGIGVKICTVALVHKILSFYIGFILWPPPCLDLEPQNLCRLNESPTTVDRSHRAERVRRLGPNPAREGRAGYR